MVQWNYRQLNRGGRSSFSSEALQARRVMGFFNDYRSIRSWWESNAKALFSHEFVEFVEEQRSKAA